MTDCLTEYVVQSVKPNFAAWKNIEPIKDPIRELTSLTLAAFISQKMAIIPAMVPRVEKTCPRNRFFNRG